MCCWWLAQNWRSYRWLICSTCFGACMSYCLCWHPHCMSVTSSITNWTYACLSLSLPLFLPLPLPLLHPSLPSIQEHYSQHRRLFQWWMLCASSRGSGQASQETRACAYPPSTEEGMQHKWSKYLRCLPSHRIAGYFCGWKFSWKAQEGPQNSFSCYIPLRIT